MFDLAVDSRLRGCDPVRMKVSDILHRRHDVTRATMTQHKTQRPVRIELTALTGDAAEAWIEELCPTDESFLSRSRAPSPRTCPPGNIPGLSKVGQRRSGEVRRSI